MTQGRRPDPSSRPQRVLALLVAGPLTLAEIREKLQLEETQFRNTFNALQRVGKIRVVDQVPRCGNRGPLVVARWGLGR